ncbi:MAG: phosphate ABC transporter permease family protein, partial [Burkholderiaceae bacterium]
MEVFIFTSVQTLLAIIAISILYGFATYRMVYAERKTAKFDSLPKYYIYWSGLIALLPALLFLLFTTVVDGIVFKYWLQSFYPNLVELNQTAKEINFIKVMNELDGITFGKPESWVV